jgi:hypothetical protein
MDKENSQHGKAAICVQCAVTGCNIKRILFMPETDEINGMKNP